EPTRQTGHKSSGIGLNSRGLHDLFVAHARHRIGFLVHIDANVDNPATIGEALVCHGEFLIKALRVSVLERIFSFFPSLSAIPRELIQHSDFLMAHSSGIWLQHQHTMHFAAFAPAFSPRLITVVAAAGLTDGNTQ